MFFDIENPSKPFGRPSKPKILEWSSDYVRDRGSIKKDLQRLEFAGVLAIFSLLIPMKMNIQIFLKANLCIWKLFIIELSLNRVFCDSLPQNTKCCSRSKDVNPNPIPFPQFQFLAIQFQFQFYILRISRQEWKLPLIPSSQWRLFRRHLMSLIL